ncbi:MAG TPA: SurA N-terminal domain-containing protein [Rhizomicrobium sp.]|nr:SurA N-terminal domain-containing protein [Rhizomicrobium sp.]
MLQTMRKFSQSWAVKIMFVGLVLSFVLWGVGDIFRGGSNDTSVASVGGTKIDANTFQRDYKNLVRNAGVQRGADLTPEEAQKAGLADRALQALINQTAIDRLTDHLGLVMGDAQISQAIRSLPAFAGPLGTFDEGTFQQRLQQYGFTEQSFIDAMRSDGIRQQVLSAARNGFTVPAGFGRALFAYMNERRAVQYVEVTDAALAPIADPTDAQLNAFIKQHPDRFSVPDYRAITYAVVGPEDLLGQVSVTDAQVAQEYDNRKTDPQYNYIIPEKRDVEQLNFKDAASAKAASAKIATGTSFADLAKSLGTQPISLGTVTASSLGDRGAPVFALPENGVTQPLKNLSGYALLHVSKITPGKITTLADVKDEITKFLKTKLAIAKAEDIANAYTDASSGGLSLQDAAKKVGMRVVRVPAVDQSGLAPDGSKANVPADPQFQSEMFKAEVGQEGDTFESKDGHVYVLKVESDTPSRLKPLAAVRQQATAMWLADARQKALAAKAQVLAAKAGKDFAGVAQSLNATPKPSEALYRDKASGDLPVELVTKIFSTPPGSAVSGQSAKGDTYIVARVTGVMHPPPPMGDPNYLRFINEVSAGTADDIAQTVAQAERDKQGVTVNQKQVDQATGSGGEGS